MMLKLRSIKLAGFSRRLFLIAGFFMLGVSFANAAETITVPVHKVEILKLDRNAGVVLIANPTIADVAVESERMIFLFGLEPGETNLLILDTEGNEILTAPIVVIPLLERVVTVNRASENEEATLSCAPRCASVATPEGTGSDAQATGSAAGAAPAAAAPTAAAPTAAAPAETTESGS